MQYLCQCTRKFSAIRIVFIMSSERKRRALEKHPPEGASPIYTEELEAIHTHEAAACNDGCFDDIDDPLSVHRLDPVETYSNAQTSVPSKDL